MIKKIYKFIWDKLGYFFIGGIALASTVAIIPNEPTEKVGSDIQIMTVDEKISTELVSYENIIKTDLQDNGKYKRQDEKEIDGVKYRTDEYETSKGEIGYTITMTKEENGKVYRKAISTGVQQKDREYDWRLIEDNTPQEISEEIATTTTKIIK